MAFFAPLMLFGLLGAAVPVIFHLMRRSSAKTIEWGAYMFLLESLASRRRRMRIEEALLLSCRILAVLLLALALARPFLPEMKFGGGSARDIVIVLDASASMGIRQADGRTNFELAVAEAHELVKKAPRGAAFGLVVGGAIPRTLTPAPISDKREFFTFLDSLREPEAGTMDAHRTLSAASMVLAAGNRAGKQIVLFGDGQAAGWDADDAGRWKVMETIFSRLPTKPQVVWRTLAAPATVRNVGVRSITPSHDVVGVDRETVFRITIVNTGTEAVTPGEVSLLVDGRSVRSTPVGMILPGSEQTLELRHRFDKPGAREVSAAVAADDDLPSDDRATTVVHVLDALRVWIVEGRPEANRFDRAAPYLSVALKPISREDEAAEKADSAATAEKRRSDFLVEPRVVTPAQLERAENFDTDLAVVILADVPRLPSSAAKNLADFVFRGGGLLVSPGAKAQPDFYNGWKRDEDPLLPFPLAELEFAQDRAEAPLYAPDTFTGEEFSSLGAAGGDLATVRATGRWRMDEETADERFRAGAVDGRFDDGEAAFASRPFGRGRVIVSALPLDASLSQLPARASFVPLAHELICNLAGATVSHLNIQPSEGATLLLSAGGRVEAGIAPGLNAVYWSNERYHGIPCVTGSVAKVDFDWNMGSPDPKVPSDRFSCRFTGMLAARKTGDYEFILECDDGGSLYIDGKLWRGGWIHLAAGASHVLKVDCFENYGQAHVYLKWREKNGPWEMIPSDCLFRYASDYDGGDTAGIKSAVEVEDPNGVRFGAVLTRTPRGPAVRISRPLTPGVYRIHLSDSGDTDIAALCGEKRVVPFSVQDRAIEGDMTPLDGEALETVRRSIPLAVATKAEDVLAAIAGRTFGIEIWRPLALWALVFLVVEILLTRWIAIGRRTGERQEISFSAEPAAPRDEADDVQEAGPAIRPTDPRVALVALPVIFVLGWCAIKLLARGMHLATPWPAGAIAAIAAVALAALLFLYDRERAVVSRRAGRALFALRALCVFIALWMLLQPVLAFDRARRVHRRVAVLLDESLSMFRRETQWTHTEELDVAQALGRIDAEARPFSLADVPFEKLRTQAAVCARLLEPHRGEEPAEVLRAVDVKGGVKEIVKAADAVDPLSETLGKLRGIARIDRRGGIETMFNAMQEIKTARDALRDSDLSAQPVDKTIELVETISSAAERCLENVQTAHECEDDAIADGLDGENRARLNAATRRPRIEIARTILAGTNGVPSLLSAISERYDVEFYRFGSDVKKIADPAEYLADSATNGVTERLAAGGSSALPELGADDSFRAGTDLVRSLESVLDEVPSEELAGALVVTDGRHTGGGGLEAVARRFAHAAAPVSSIVVGGTRSAPDVSLTDVRAAESVFLGDRVRASAQVSAHGLKGRKVKVRLMLGEEEIDSKELEVESGEWSAEVRLTDEPKERGVRSYRVEAVPVDGETELSNNEWEFDASVSDDRVNVLLVDRRPRWEFRYLRNLFYARDKSVHLQYYLTEPDHVSGQPYNPPPASAARAFGDAEAGALPVNRDEWRKFDVIVLGDVGENTLTPAAVKDIKHCVEERGATLVFIAGQKRMPSAIRNPALLELLPVVCSNRADAAELKEDGFVVTPTPAGRSHECMALSDSPSENERIWSEQPVWRWRLAIDDVKPGAEVLAYAVPVVSGEAADDGEDEVWSRDASGEEAVKKLDEIRKRQARNAILVAKDQGRGKTVMLLSDETWRLRYRVGDTYHHRFWGQVLRWGVGERMRAGNEFARLGTDRLSYEPGSAVRISARLAGTDFSPLNGAIAEAVVSLGGTTDVARVRLENVPDSNGVYEGRLDPAPAPGRYTVRLECGDAERALGEKFPAGLSTDFTVASLQRPVEFTHLTADLSAPRVLARISGGRATGPLGAAELADGFGEAGGTLTDHIEISFWDRPWLFLIYLIALVLEWTLRHRNGLA